MPNGADTLLKRTNKFNLIDVAAIVCLTFFSVLYVAIAKTGVNAIDESFYLTIPQRLFKGDGLLVDEWHVSQFSSLFQYIPFRIFYLVTGSTQGIVLYSRYVYIFCQMIFSSYLYVKLRKEGFFGLLATVLFCGFVPANVMAINYYTLSSIFSALMCTVLFLKKEAKWYTLLLCGVLFSFNVLLEPMAAVLYIVYCFFVIVTALIRKIKPEFLSDLKDIVSGKGWLAITFSAAVCALALFVFLHSRADLASVFSAIPELFTDSEYSSQNLFDFESYAEYFGIYGIPFLICLIAFLAVVLLDRKRLESRRQYFLIGSVLLIVALSLFTANMFGGDIMMSFRSYKLIPLYVFGLACYILTEKTDRRLFAFWVYGVAMSVVIDISSDISIGYAEVVTVVASVIMFGRLFNEMKADESEEKLLFVRLVSALGLLSEREGKECSLSYSLKNIKSITQKSVKTLLCIVVTAVIGFESLFLITECSFRSELDLIFSGEENAELNSEITTGPLKGIRTTPAIKECYDKIITDLDYIKERNDKQNIYVADLLSWSYLHLDMPYSAYSAWYVFDDMSTRQLRYWKKNSDKIPGYVYIPTTYWLVFSSASSADEKLKFITDIFECDVINGTAGYIIKVNDWKE